MHALWMVLGAFMFATMGACVKIASAYFSAAEMVFYRGLIGMVMMALLARYQRISLATQHPGMHAWRNLVGVVSLGAWFYAIGALPLPTAMTFNYMSSIWIGIFVVASGLLYWRPTPQTPSPPMHGALLATILLGFVGVVLMLRPSFAAEQSFAATVGLISGVFAALAYMQVVALARVGEPETRVVFYFAASGALAGGLVMLATDVHSLASSAALWLLPIGVFATLGQLCMTHAYSTAASPRNTLVVASLQYTGIIFATFYGLVFFDDPIPFWSWVGMAIIVVCGLMATLLRARGTKP